MTITLFSAALATEIVGTWKKNRSNHIVVAPPLSNCRALFTQLCDKNFVRSILGNHAEKVAIAKLDTSDFKDDITFARQVLRGWNVYYVDDAGETDAVTLLSMGTFRIQSNGGVPVIVIHRFHEALQKLGEEIGTALRNLEHDHGLKTVVELPISLAFLRERWDAMEIDNPPFLASDWGQGHSVKLLKGYSVEEVRLLAEPVHADIPATIIKLTGGIVGLVQELLEPARTKSSKALNSVANSKAPAACERLISWIDKPNENFYKTLLVKSLGEPGASQGASRLSDHDWRDVILSNDGTVSCLMLGWACVEKLGRGDIARSLQEALYSFKDAPLSRTLALIASLPAQLFAAAPERRDALDLLVRFSHAAGPYMDDWAPARQILEQFRQLAASTRSLAIKSAGRELELWMPLVNLMCDFAYKKRNQPRIRLEEFAAANNNPAEIGCVLQLHQLRLHGALSLTPLLALKSVVEQPESLLQLYLHLVHRINFWNFQGISEEESQKISNLLRKPFKVPQPGSRLGFIEMLYIAFIKSDGTLREKCLFDGYAEMMHVELLYDERKQQVHSVAIVSGDDWLSYQKLCTQWIDKLWKLLNGGPLQLPSCSSVFADLIQAQ